MKPIFYYVILRKDLINVQSIIQASHSGIEMGMRMNEEDKVLDRPLHVCLLEVSDEQELISFWRHLKMQGWYEGKDFTVFFEPDRDDGWTCITTRPVQESEREIFANETMYTFEENQTMSTPYFDSVDIQHALQPSI